MGGARGDSHSSRVPERPRGGCDVRIFSPNDVAVVHIRGGEPRRPSGRAVFRVFPGFRGSEVVVSKKGLFYHRKCADSWNEAMDPGQIFNPTCAGKICSHDSGPI